VPSRENQIVEGLLEAYRQGAFPMADSQTGRINWYSPDPRAILPIDAPPGAPGGMRISRSLRARVRAGRFIITTDRAFERVIRACAQPRGDGGEWINDQIIAAYTFLHRAGAAHSVEAWLPGADAPAEGDPGILVGGLYGVHIASAFFGESMFSRPDAGGTDASKVCLVYLVNHLRARAFTLLDTQFSNPHMEQFGLHEIPRATYLKRLRSALKKPCTWAPWTDSISAR
jgi:leucyl/phenylalanyl-tRNA---protein transferase